WWVIGFHVAVFATVAVCCHLELSRSRPQASRLTEFYLWVSLGGVLGGLFNGLIAPVAFRDHYEYTIGLLAACFLIAPDPPADTDRFGWLHELILAGLGLWVYFSLSNYQAIVSHPPLVWVKDWLNGRDETGRADEWLTRLQAVVCYAFPAFLCFIFVGRPWRF